MTEEETKSGCNLHGPYEVCGHTTETCRPDSANADTTDDDLTPEQSHKLQVKSLKYSMDMLDEAGHLGTWRQDIAMTIAGDSLKGGKLEPMQQNRLLGQKLETFVEYLEDDVLPYASDEEIRVARQLVVKLMEFQADPKTHLEELSQIF
ncbi:MAG TPA: hypothetical protein VJH75_01415 [Patescibacteria group bacterium]|nr:hypothetical protein [Patescibacteria group bacterium]